MITTIFGIVIFLMLSAFFSGAEMAYVSANKLGIEIMKEQGSRRGNILADFYNNPKRFLGTMLVGNNIALVIYTYFMAELVNPVLEPSIGNGIFMLLVSSVLITIVVLIFGEFLPKTLFRLFANEAIFFLTYPLLFFKYLLALPTALTTLLSNWMLRYVFKSPEEKALIGLSRVDLENFIEDNIKDGDADIDKTILTNALNLGLLKVRNCMIPRTEIVTVDKSQSVDDLLQTFLSSKHSRIIVIDGDIDKTIGYVHHQQLLKKPKSIKKMLMPLPFIPEAMNVRELMTRFIKDGTNIACVVNEFGGVAGMITLEDILEEIFGDIADEHDQEDYIDEKLGENQYLFSGRLELDYINDKYDDIELPSGEFSTLSGLIVMTTGSIPLEGDMVNIDEYVMKIEKVSKNKVELVRLIKKMDLDE